MHHRIILTLLAGVAVVSADDNPVTGELGNATVVENNPPDIEYRAVPPKTAFATSAYPNGGNIEGSISAMANPNGIGVKMKVRFSNLPKEGGPFLYHIHVNAVPDDGNCTETLGHLDPFIRGETPACDQDLPQTCQVGDLSGKHGKITTDPFEAEYTDDFASTLEGIGAFFGNRSFVVHFANTTRITCGSFQQVVGGVSTVTFTATATGTAAASTQTGGGSSTTATGATLTTSSGPTVVTSSPPFVTVSAGATKQPLTLLTTAMLLLASSAIIFGL